MQAADATLIEEPAAPPTQRWRWLRYLVRDKKALVGLIVALGVDRGGDPGALDRALRSQRHDLRHDRSTILGAPPGHRRPGAGPVEPPRLRRPHIALRRRLDGRDGTRGGRVPGGLAGYFGGFLDTVIMRYIDLQWAFPNLLIAVYLVAVFGTGLSNVLVAVSLAFVDDFARIARGMVLSIKEEQYVAAARVTGASHWRIMWRHILPNATAPLIVQATVSVSYAILAEATLSFLGLGVEASTPTWGLILADSRSFISRAWWLGVFPGLFIMITVLSINFLGDALRDLLDVREAKDLAHG